MADDQPDIEPDIKADMDRGESVGLMEPTQLDEGGRARGEALELAFELGKKSAGFKRSLPAPILESLAALVRSMNCYYSNLIEGHDTHPIDIERALDNDYSGDPRKRELQIEAKAHIAVQEWIDAGGLSGRGATGHAACEIHRRFYEEMPEDLCWAENPDTGERIRVVPGGFRQHDVKVGRHVAISPGAVPRFMERFDEAYGGLSATGITVAAAAAHHRLAWIHPFTDGNGRVGRLMSQATLLDSLDSGGLWSVSRGLARRVGDYKMHLANCDQPRRNSLDGRGSLSQEALADFTRFFLKMCLDQVTFMEELIEPARLRRRIEIWFEEEVRLGNLPQKAGIILSAILYRGELPRGEMDGLLGLTDRQSRRIVRPLLELGVLTSESTRAPIRLAFPATLAGRWVPGLFPEKPATEPGS